MLEEIDQSFDDEDEGAAGPTPAPQIRLRGRVVIHNAGLLVIEVFADGQPLFWAPAGDASITLTDGSVVVIPFDRQRTTRNGEVAPGAAARLAFTLAGVALGVVQSIAIEIDGATVLIEV